MGDDVVHLLLMLQEIWWGSTKKLGSEWRIPRFNTCRDDNYTTSQLNSSPQFFLAETHFKILEVTCWRSRLSCWGVWKLAVFAFFWHWNFGCFTGFPHRWSGKGWALKMTALRLNTPDVKLQLWAFFQYYEERKNVKSEWIPEKSMMVAKKFFLNKKQSAKTCFFVLKDMLFHWAGGWRHMNNFKINRL